jgi:hypothetical protein
MQCHFSILYSIHSGSYAHCPGLAREVSPTHRRRLIAGQMCTTMHILPQAQAAMARSKADGSSIQQWHTCRWSQQPCRSDNCRLCWPAALTSASGAGSAGLLLEAGCCRCFPSRLAAGAAGTAAFLLGLPGVCRVKQADLECEVRWMRPAHASNSWQQTNAHKSDCYCSIYNTPL